MNTELINKIRFLFSNEEAKKLIINDKLIPNDYWYKINLESEIQSTGFCYLASEVYYKLNNKSKEWWFKELKSDLLPYNGYHYFLQHKITNEIIDITADQFKGIDIPYDKAKNKGIRFSSKQCNSFIKLLNI
jgi:hypothetical protein